MKDRLTWLSVDAASARVAKWPEWKRNYRLTKYSKGYDNMRPVNEGKRDIKPGV
jgi:hypothetical protein